MAQKNAKELHFWQSINKMNGIGNVLQLASSHKDFTKLLNWKFLSEDSTNVWLVQALENITKSIALESICGSKVPAWSEPWQPTIGEKFILEEDHFLNHCLVENLMELSK